MRLYWIKPKTLLSVNALDSRLWGPHRTLTVFSLTIEADRIWTVKIEQPWSVFQYKLSVYHLSSRLVLTFNILTSCERRHFWDLSRLNLRRAKLEFENETLILKKVMKRWAKVKFRKFRLFAIKMNSKMLFIVL